MIGLIVTGHGHFATGITSSLNLIAGDLQDYAAVDFPQEFSTDDLAKALNEAMESLAHCDGILVLSDIPGGSPFKTAVEVGFPKGNVAVVAGTNMPMAISANLMRGFMDLDSLKESVLNEARSGIVAFELQVEEDVEPEDGI